MSVDCQSITCDKEATWQCIWGAESHEKDSTVSWCDECWEYNISYRPQYMLYPVRIAELTTEDDFWKELYDQGEDRLNS